MEAAVRGHGYAMQVALYALAVHRWLRARVPGYTYEKQFGGVGFMFLRGIGDPRSEDPAAGVQTMRPPQVMIDALDEALDDWRQP